MADEEVIIDVLSDQPAPNNGWEPVITNSATHWKNVATRLLDAYDKRAENLKLKINRIKKILLVISAVSMIMSLLDINKEAFEFKVVLVVTTTIEFLVSGYMNVEGWSESFEIYTKYVSRLRNFLGSIASELCVPVSYRIPGATFMEKHKDKFQELLMEKPPIPGQELHYTEGERERGLNLHRQLPDFTCADVV